MWVLRATHVLWSTEVVGPQWLTASINSILLAGDLTRDFWHSSQTVDLMFTKVKRANLILALPLGLRRHIWQWREAQRSESSSCDLIEILGNKKRLSSSVAHYRPCCTFCIRARKEHVILCVPSIIEDLSLWFCL